MKKNKGFTLVELLVTISLIAVLTAIAIVYYGNTQKKARDNKRRSDLEQVRAALEMYRSQNGSYPAGSWSDLGSALTGGTDPYISELPSDPRSSYNYYYDSAGTTYDLCAYLEGDNPGDCPGSPSCGDSNCNYGVTNP
jgi:prepilin-type N-terminal cleavage/methylation domain-containing protein